jgi:hypothetical protein
MAMKKFYISAVFVVLLFTVKFVAQEASEAKPEMSVAGIELGDRESAKKFLTDGYAPRIGEDGRVSYYFYNKWATQVMRLEAPSYDDRFFITGIEVFRVGESYRERHFQAEEIKLFETENRIFIGFKQSAAYLIAGVKNAGATNEFKSKHIVKLKGEPSERVATEEEKRETLVYRGASVELKDGRTAGYEAEYEFYKDKLKRFRLQIEPESAKLAEKE